MNSHLSEEPSIVVEAAEARSTGRGDGQLSGHAAWRTCLDAEVSAFRLARERKDVPVQWQSLERAHILSQIALGPHLQVHWMMLGVAVRTSDGREVLGQLVRLALAPLGSVSGRIPWGNTGRSTVSAFTPMPIPADLRDVLPPAIFKR